MKQAITFYLFFVVAFTGLSQSTDGLPRNEAQQVEYKDVINLEGQTKDDLYSKGLSWIAIAFVSANDVVQYKDKDEGKIIAKGRIPTGFFGNNSSMDGHYRLTLTLEFKDHKARVTIQNISHEAFKNGKDLSGGDIGDQKSDIGMYLPRNYWLKVKKDANIQIAKLISEIEESLSGDESSDDW